MNHRNEQLLPMRLPPWLIVSMLGAGIGMAGNLARAVSDPVGKAVLAYGVGVFLLGFCLRPMGAIWPALLHPDPFPKRTVVACIGFGLGNLGVLVFIASGIVRWFVLKDLDLANMLGWTGAGLFVFGGIASYVGLLIDDGGERGRR